MPRTRRFSQLPATSYQHTSSLSLRTAGGLSVHHWLTERITLEVRIVACYRGGRIEPKR
jgi:hypothetical protein